MVPSISGLLLVAVFLVFGLRNITAGFQAATALLAFSATAAFTLTAVGGMSFGPATFAFGLIIGVLALRFVRQPFLIQPLLRYPSVLILLLICAYGLISALAFPRLFEGQTWVFSMSRDAVGVAFAPNVPSRISLLEPTSSNLSQPMYFCLSAFVFIAASFLARVHGPEVLDKGISWLAGVNLVLGIMDLAGLDPVLDFFQTASYAILDTHIVAGIPRVIGGTPEASVYASLSISLGVYFAARYVHTPRALLGVLGLGNIIGGMLALSTTGIVSLAAALLYAVCLTAAGGIVRGRTTKSELRLLMYLTGGGILFAGVLMPLIGPQIIELFQALVLDKATSDSGVERGAWAAQGIRVGLETYGLGAGLGSTRANGLVSSWFSSMGAPGIVLLFGFLGVVMLRSPTWTNREHQQYWHASNVALIAILASLMASATTPDPGILFMLFAAIAVRSKQRIGVVSVAPSGRVASPQLGLAGS
jgi:hypothetical protein